MAAVVASLAFAEVARAEDNGRCTLPASVGKSCETAGPNANQPGICENVACSTLDGGAGDGGLCIACLVDGTAGGCGGGRPVDSSKASFTPTVGGCCSVAGTHAWESGAGLLLATFGLGLAFVQRRRRR